MQNDSAEITPKVVADELNIANSPLSYSIKASLVGAISVYLFFLFLPLAPLGVVWMFIGGMAKNEQVKRQTGGAYQLSMVGQVNAIKEASSEGIGFIFNIITLSIWGFKRGWQYWKFRDSKLAYVFVSSLAISISAPAIPILALLLPLLLMIGPAVYTLQYKKLSQKLNAEYRELVTPTVAKGFCQPQQQAQEAPSMKQAA